MFIKYDPIKKECIKKIQIVINKKIELNEWNDNYISDPEKIYYNMYNELIINNLFDECIRKIINIINNSLKDLNLNDELIDEIDKKYYIELWE